MSRPEVEGCCPFWRSGGLHGEDCYDQGREDCAAFKRGMPVILPPSPARVPLRRGDVVRMVLLVVTVGLLALVGWVML